MTEGFAIGAIGRYVTARQSGAIYLAIMAAVAGVLQSSRLRAMVIPREHGAWGMLLVPLATGAVIAAATKANYSPLAMFVIAVLSLFWLRTPVEALAGSSAIKVNTKQERALVKRVAVGLLLIAAISIGALLLSGFARGMLIVGGISAAAFAAQAVVKNLGRDGRMPAQVLGAIGLTSTSAGAYLVMRGQLDRVAVAIWLANWLFAANQVHFVQLRIRGSRRETFSERFRFGLSFLSGTVALVIVILVGTRLALFPRYALVAFLPGLLRGLAWFLRPRQPLDVHKLGLSELMLGIGFGILLCVTFRLTGL